jgi:hypothetical protein
MDIVDDRAKKHIYAVIDEPTRNIYAEFMAEVRAKNKRL